MQSLQMTSRFKVFVSEADPKQLLTAFRSRILFVRWCLPSLNFPPSKIPTHPKTLLQWKRKSECLFYFSIIIIAKLN